MPRVNFVLDYIMILASSLPVHVHKTLINNGLFFTFCE